VDNAYAQAMKANAEGTSTVAPKATYFRCSQVGHCSRVSVPAPESQKNNRLMGLIRFMTHPTKAAVGRKAIRKWRRLTERLEVVNRIAPARPDAAAPCGRPRRPNAAWDISHLADHFGYRFSTSLTGL
jgi:hypothetical protein